MNTQVATGTSQTLAVGRYRDGGEMHFLPYSIEELERGKNAFLRVLQSFHLRSGRNLLVASLFDETAQFLPIERAIIAHDLVVCSADASFFDAARTESIIRRFNVAAVVGVTPEQLDGLAALGHDVAALFRDLIVWARPGAYERLREVDGITLRRWFEVGPAVAYECAAGAGAHIDRFEWKVEAVNGEIVISSQLNRALEFDGFHSGIRGRIEHAACGCGNADPRIVV